MQLLNIINNCFEYSLSEKNTGIGHTLNRILSELCKYINAETGGIAEKWISEDNEPYLKYYALHGVILDAESKAKYLKMGYLEKICYNIDFDFTENITINHVDDDTVINIFPLLSKKAIIIIKNKMTAWK